MNIAAWFGDGLLLSRHGGLRHGAALAQQGYGQFYDEYYLLFNIILIA